MIDSVSIIIPTWNRARTLVAAVTSVLNQTYPPLEVLVCDDGSTDSSKQNVQAIGDPCVRWIEGDHAGRPAIPRNRGIKESRGQWIAFLDSDDQWLPEKLERQLAAANQLGCKAASTNALRWLPESASVSGNLLAYERNKISFIDLAEVNHVVSSSAIVHRSVLRFISGFPENRELTALEDYACWLRVATQTDFAYVGESLVIYRDDPSASLRRNDPDVWTQRSLVFRDFLNWARTKSQTNDLAGYIETVNEQMRRDELQQRPDLPSLNEFTSRVHMGRIRRVGSKVKRALFG